MPVLQPRGRRLQTPQVSLIGWVVGFGCSLEAWLTGRDISEHGDWLTAQRAARAGVHA